MKKFLLIFIFSSSFLFSQEYYWTSYSFNVDPEDVETVGKLTDDYFSKEGSKSDGVTVRITLETVLLMPHILLYCMVHRRQWEVNTLVVKIQTFSCI